MHAFFFDKFTFIGVDTLVLLSAIYSIPGRACQNLISSTTYFCFDEVSLKTK